MKKLAIFASGNGTNAERLINYFAHSHEVAVACLVYNRREAMAAQRAQRLGIEAQYFNRADFADAPKILAYLASKDVDYVVLAGFLLQVPQYLIDAYPDRIINIHPSLLPLHGGKGMYGLKVHQDVLDSHESSSGITIHLVDTHLDTGRILFQAQCEVRPEDDAETLAQRVHQLEYEHFPKVVENYVVSQR